MAESENIPQQTPPVSPTPEKPARSKGWLIILIALAIISLIIFRDAFRSIDWLTDYQTARQQAGQQHKPLLIFFVKPGDAECERMKNITYADKRIVKYISSSFVAVLLDFDKNQSLAQKFQVEQLPFTVVLNTKTEKFATVPGYVNLKEFNGRLRRARQKILQPD